MDFNINEMQLSELNTRIEDTNKNVMRLMNALLPNDITGGGGLVSDVNNIRREVKVLKDTLDENRRKIDEKINSIERNLEMKFDSMKNEIDDLKMWRRDIGTTLKLVAWICGVLFTVGTLGIQLLSYLKK
jgi:hypothetical protein